MITQQYRVNRSNLAREVLEKYQDSWVAFSQDGCRVVASAPNVGQLEENLRAMGQDAQSVVFEWVAGPEDDSVPGGSELY